MNRRQTKLTELVKKWTAKLQNHQQARLVTALLFFASLIPLAWDATARWEFLVAGVLLLIFIVLVIRTKNIRHHLQKIDRLLQFSVRQSKRQAGLPSGRQWKHIEELVPHYPLIRDIGLTGSHSLWTLLDETITESGQRKLLSWMSAAPMNPDFLRHRQQKIKNLRPQTWFFTRLGIEANADELNVSSHQINDFLRSSFVTPSFNKVFLANILLWLLIVSLFIFSKISGTSVPGLIIMSFPIVSWISLGFVGNAFIRGVGLSHHLGVLGPLFSSIEKRMKFSKALREVCPVIEKESPATDVKKLEFILNFVGTQTNPLLHFLLNGLMPWTQVAVFFLENHRRKVAKTFPPCLEELSEFEVLGSLLIFDRYQTQTYPEFVPGQILECQQIFHPLLERSKAVANDFAFPQGRSLGLLTGSNMSGKSTFLRTIGINQVLANMGAPVFAKLFKTSPLKIETCIEVTDSLRDGYSYFYAEVRRLKDILTAAAKKEPVLYLIDEIFRGTNNRERQVGSRAVIRTLANESTSLGFISTHDLELTTLEKSNPSVLNLHFKEDINADGKMVFSYHLNPGPCPTTNALRIMKAEGIDVEES